MPVLTGAGERGGIAVDLAGRRVLVTGSTRGIGKAIALELAEHGAQVVVHGPQESEELQTATAAVQAISPASFGVTGDLSIPREIELLFEAILERAGGLDVLINNAATQNPAGILDIETDAWDYLMAVNLRAPFLCAQHAGRLMIAGGHGGKIVNISSVHGQQPRRNFAHYSCAKAGLEQLTRCLALELAPYNIQANAVVAGAVATGLTPAGRQESISTAIPMGRVGEVGEIARLAAFLSSGACDYITGSCITVDGGLTLGFCASRPDL